MRRASVKAAARNAPLLDSIRELKSDHPFWGYRRVWARLKYGQGLEVNKKRVYRLMKEAGLLVAPNLKIKARRSATGPKPRPTAPNEWWGIDMTKALIGEGGWVYIVVVLDWYTKKVVGCDVGTRSKSTDWLSALETAVNRQFPDGVRDKGLSLMSDNGCQPTSVAFMEACSTLGIRQAFTSYNNPKGNADTERMMRTIKEELIWLHDWTSAAQLKARLTEWFEEYNVEYLHSTLGYKTPQRFEAEYKNSHATLLAGA